MHRFIEFAELTETKLLGLQCAANYALGRINPGILQCKDCNVLKINEKGLVMVQLLELKDAQKILNRGSARFKDYEQAAIKADAGFPVAVVDLAAFSYNAHDMLRRAEGVPIRVASKSLRCPELIKATLALTGYEGVLGFSIAEAIHLVDSDITADVVVAYPVLDFKQLQRLHSNAKYLRSITLMIDHPDQLALLSAARKRFAADKDLPPTRLCLDIDCSLRLGKLHIGARRSAVRTPESAVAAAHAIQKTAGFQLVGIMGYEAQIAGLNDSSPAVIAMKTTSARELQTRRTQIVQAVREVCDLEFVNGGGTGSIESTRAETEITEIAAGSGFYAPHLFDGYRSFQPKPAAFFGLQVTRRPAPQIVTVHGGGWIASGAAGVDRLPQPVWPAGLSLTAMEGAGEVQTPLKANGIVPAVGETVWFRHTKAGELCEHVNELVLVATEQEQPQTAKTYRGQGHAFI